MEDAYNLSRFLDAQQPVYAQALDELKTGLKRGHWIWYIFPQIAGLGASYMSERYAIRSIDEARAFLDHHVLGVRLRECVSAVAAHKARSALQIFGHTDRLKLRSCLTLFHLARRDEALFQDALNQFFDGKPDRLTVEYLNRPSAASDSSG